MESPRLPAIFYAALEQELAAHPQGMSEYELIRALRAHGFFAFLPPPPAAPELLFRAHFMLFHALYELRDRLSCAELGWLEIGALCIRRLPGTASERALAQPDNLRQYYLDWSNLDLSTGDTIAELIDSFWRRLARIEGRAEALAQLGLEDPVDDQTIKLTWRRLAMAYHPDRGGDKARLQAINAALGCLIK